MEGVAPHSPKDGCGPVGLQCLDSPGRGGTNRPGGGALQRGGGGAGVQRKLQASSLGYISILGLL